MIFSLIDFSVSAKLEKVHWCRLVPIYCSTNECKNLCDWFVHTCVDCEIPTPPPSATSTKVNEWTKKNLLVVATLFALPRSEKKLSIIQYSKSNCYGFLFRSFRLTLSLFFSVFWLTPKATVNGNTLRECLDIHIY